LKFQILKSLSTDNSKWRKKSAAHLIESYYEWPVPGGDNRKIYAGSWPPAARRRQQGPPEAALDPNRAMTNVCNGTMNFYGAAGRLMRKMLMRQPGGGPCEDSQQEPRILKLRLGTARTRVEREESFRERFNRLFGEILNGSCLEYVFEKVLDQV
jgi:hypothetical protein